MSSFTEQDRLITRRQAIGRVSMLLGGVTLIGGSALLEACSKDQPRATTTTAGTGTFTPDDIAFLDEVADTILPTTQKSPGAKAAQTGAFMALMVTDTYDPKDQQTFRDGMTKLDDASKKANNVGFVQATPQQRLALLEQLDKEAKTYMDQRAAAGAQAQAAEAARPIEQAPGGGGKSGKDTGQLANSAGKGTESEKHLEGDPRQQNAVGAGNANPAAAITADAPPHYFRMMKELAMLGFFTSEIGYTKAMRYQETPARFDPCIPYTKGDKAWAPHA
ncbi:MAG: gluconate 2-dehydrogenase subunit 3 family protein [Gemmatirosa sp.]|nr:gluconate 2-dehydrogenase subunit 3 family protein [Gemmatirosa sp.]